MAIPPNGTTQPTILFVDDDPGIRRSLTRLFRSEDVRVLTAGSTSEAIATIEREPVHVVVTDHHMPGESGVSLLSQIRVRRPEIIRMMLTSTTQIAVAIDAIHRGGIFRWLTKPWDESDLRTAVREALDAYVQRREDARRSSLEHERSESLHRENRSLLLQVYERTKELENKNAELCQAYVSTVRALARAVDAKDSYTRNHSERVGLYALRIASELGFPEREAARIYLAGLLHDIGKIGIPDEIISKPAALTAQEFAIMRRHPQIGADILRPVSFLSDIGPLVRHHHEWYDGSELGYPDRLAGERIPLGSRVLLVADTIEAMSSDRPYRAAQPLDRIVDEIVRFRATQFDPDVVDAAIDLLDREGKRFFHTLPDLDPEQLLAEAS